MKRFTDYTQDDMNELDEGLLKNASTATILLFINTKNNAIKREKNIQKKIDILSSIISAIALLVSSTSHLSSKGK